MVSFIVTSPNKADRESHVTEFAQKHSINAFDITIIDKEAETKATQSIGIDTIKIIRKKLFLTPIKSQMKLLVIEDAQLLTPEAQNALLKMLEEPPEHTYIILGSTNIEVLLPTIRSRCTIIALQEPELSLTEKNTSEMMDFINSLRTLSVGDRLKKAEQLAKDKDKAVEWLRLLIVVMRNHMLEKTKQTSETSSSIGKNIKALQTLHTILKTTNVNPRFAIEQTFLSL